MASFTVALRRAAVCRTTPPLWRRQCKCHAGLRQNKRDRGRMPTHRPSSSSCCSRPWARRVRWAASTAGFHQNCRLPGKYFAIRSRNTACARPAPAAPMRDARSPVRSPAHTRRIRCCSAPQGCRGSRQKTPGTPPCLRSGNRPERRHQPPPTAARRTGTAPCPSRLTYSCMQI